MSIAIGVREPETLPDPGCGRVTQALADIAEGRMVVVGNDLGGRDHGVLVLPAFAATGAALGSLIRNTSGLLVGPMSGPDLERLGLAAGVAQPRDPQLPAYTVPVDAVSGIRAGSSPAERATTLRALADPGTTPEGLRSPGHVQPVGIAEHGVLERGGDSEAAFDLMRMAGVPAVGVVAELVGLDGAVRSVAASAGFAAEHRLSAVPVTELVAYRQRHEQQLERVTQARIPTAHGEFRAVGYRHVLERTEHVALVHGDISRGEDAPVRVHRECQTGDPFRSLGCDCRARLDAAMSAVVADGRGVVVYVRQPPRGVGESVKTARDDVIATQILTDLGAAGDSPSLPLPSLTPDP